MTSFDEKSSTQNTKENEQSGNEKKELPIASATSSVASPASPIDTIQHVESEKIPCEKVESNSTNNLENINAQGDEPIPPSPPFITSAPQVSSSDAKDSVENTTATQTTSETSATAKTPITISTESFEGIAPEELTKNSSHDALNTVATAPQASQNQEKSENVSSEKDASTQEKPTVEKHTDDISSTIQDDNDDDKPMTLRDHFRELRKRLCWAFLFAILGFCICYPFAQEIFKFLVMPLDLALPPGSKFQYTAAHEAFFVFMKVGFVAGIFLMSPFIFYQFWAFIAPGLYKSERVYVIPIAIASAVFFIGGGAFCYFVVFPFAFKFFMQYSHGRIIAMPTLKDSFGFVLQMIFAFGLVFELPLFVFFLARIGLVTAGLMRRMRRYAILANVIIAAILTPPDVISQLLMACPMILLYEFSIYIAQIFGRKEKTKEEDEDEGEADSDEMDRESPKNVATTPSSHINS